MLPKKSRLARGYDNSCQEMRDLNELAVARTQESSYKKRATGRRCLLYCQRFNTSSVELAGARAERRAGGEGAGAHAEARG